MTCRSDNESLNEYYKKHGFIFKGACDYGGVIGNRYEIEVGELL